MLSKRSSLYAVVMLVITAMGCVLDTGTRNENQTDSTVYRIPNARERFEIHRAKVAEKLTTSVLPAMRNHDVDMWIVLDRENNYEPLHNELGGGFSGVRAAFIYFDNGSDKIEKIYYGSHEQPANSVISQVYDEKKYYGYSPEGLTPLLRKAVRNRNPRRIGVNTSLTLPEADGLTVGLKNFLVETIGPRYADRLVSAELIVRDFRLNRTPLETQIYKQLLEWSSQWMSEALTAPNIVTGKTTAEDIAWWLQDQALKIGLDGSGTVRVVREGELLPIHSPHIPIEPGDILSIDGGLSYLGYAIDIKRAAYVLRTGESTLPKSMQQAWQTAHKIGNLYASKMVPGAIGHKIWAEINADIKKQGYKAVGPDAGGDAITTSDPEVGIYGHSVGNVAHDIGARIAADIPFAYGDRVRFPLVANEWVSIEFHVSTPIPEWNGRTWYARFEETAQVTENGIRWLIPTQGKLLLIKSARSESPVHN